jgi:glycosyltransferase involved in cell wall biosynthesis
MLPGLAIPLELTAVVSHGVDQAFKKPPTEDSSSQVQKFILAVSEVLEHKNLTRLVKAYCELVQSTNRDVNLVIAGTISSKNLHQSLRSFLAKQGLSQRVKFLGYVPRNELDILYQQAELLAFPSLGETFGLPLVEAMAAGLPVVTSNTTVMPEICGDAVFYFDPLDVADMTWSLTQVLDDPALRATLIQRGRKRAKAFSWSHAAHSLVSIMNEVSHRR